MPRPHPGPEWIAHRGAPREVDENTLEGFLLAVERGADAVELDVHTTSDGMVVVHHDPELDVAPGVRHFIATLTEREVRAVRLLRGGRVPTLAEVMDGLGDRATVYVEIKGIDAGERAVHVARRHGSRYAFHSFDHESVYRLHDRWPDLHYGVLLDAGAREAERAVRLTPVRDVWPHHSLVTAELVGAAHAAGKRVLAWTVNDAAMAREFALLGVDGVCTDDVRIFSGSIA